MSSPLQRTLAWISLLLGIRGILSILFLKLVFVVVVVWEGVVAVGGLFLLLWLLFFYDRWARSGCDK